jgi:hypothetical protein
MDPDVRQAYLLSREIERGLESASGMLLKFRNSMLGGWQ